MKEDRAFFGIDPGKTGAIAYFPDSESSVVIPYSFPVLVGETVSYLDEKTGKRKTKKLTPDRYDPGQFVDLVLATLRNRTATKQPPGLHLAIEELSTMPGSITLKGGAEKKLGGHKTNFSRGYIMGGIEWALATLQRLKFTISFEFIPARTWQTQTWEARTGDPNMNSLLTVKRLFPNAELRLSARARKDNSNVADAILIGEYARRKYRTRFA